MAMTGWATAGARTGTPCGSTPRRSTTACPGCRSPGRRWPYPPKDEVADYFEAYANGSSSRSAWASGSTASSPRWAMCFGPAPRTERGPECRRGDRHVRPHPEHSRLRARAGPRDPPVALQRVPPTGPTTARPGAGRRRLPLGHRRRVRGRAQPPDDPLRPGPGADPGQPEALRHGSSSRCWSSWAASDHPEDPDRPQGDGRDPLPRRPHDPGQARRSGGSRSRAPAVPGRRGPRRRPVLEDAGVDVANVVWCTGFRQVFDWIELPIWAPTAGRWSTRGVVADAPGLFFCGLAFQYAFSSMVMPGVGRDADFVAREIASGHPGRWRFPGEPAGVSSPKEGSEREEASFDDRPT